MLPPFPHPNQHEANYLKAQYEDYIKNLTGLKPNVRIVEKGASFDFHVTIPFEISYTFVQPLELWQLSAAAKDQEDLATVLGVVKTRLTQSRKDVKLNPNM